jgi:hypothetical protein
VFDLSKYGFKIEARAPATEKQCLVHLDDLASILKKKASDRQLDTTAMAYDKHRNKILWTIEESQDFDDGGEDWKYCLVLEFKSSSIFNGMIDAMKPSAIEAEVFVEGCDAAGHRIASRTVNNKFSVRTAASNTKLVEALTECLDFFCENQTTYY